MNDDTLLLAVNLICNTCTTICLAYIAAKFYRNGRH